MFSAIMNGLVINRMRNNVNVPRGAAEMFVRQKIFTIYGNSFASSAFCEVIKNISNLFSHQTKRVALEASRWRAKNGCVDAISHYSAEIAQN